MKKILIITTILLFGNTIFSQSKDEEAIKKVIKTITLSGHETINLDDYLNSFAKSEFTILNMNFKQIGYDVIKAGAESYVAKKPKPSGSTWEYSDWKIKINGTSSFARCVETRTYPTGVKSTIHKVNYLEKIGKEWKVIANIAQTQQAEIAEDEAAIKNVIETLTNNAGSNNVPAYMNLLAKTDYISRVSVEPDGKASKLIGSEYTNLLKGREVLGIVKDKSKVTRSNYLIRINGNAAFVVFDQHNDFDDGTKRDSIEERFLEKINGEWKIVNVTVIPKKPL